MFDVTRLNPDEHYDNTTGIYTVPLDGIYEFTFHIWTDNDPLINPYLNIDGTRVKLSDVYVIKFINEHYTSSFICFYI